MFKAIEDSNGLSSNGNENMLSDASNLLGKEIDGAHK
jgi:hypothetical protein